MSGSFNPNRKEYGLGGQMKSGKHVLAIKKMERRNGPQASYVSAEVVGVSPSVRGGRLYTNFSFSPQALWRLGNLAQSIGMMEEGDLGHDSYLRKFMGKPFKAEVVKTGQYHDIARFHPWDEDDPMREDVHGWSPPEGTGEVKYADGYYHDFAGFEGDQDPGYEPEREVEGEPPHPAETDGNPEERVPYDDDDEDIPF